MKKLSLILVLIMTLSIMVGMLAIPAFAAGDGTEANPITVGGEGADYATVAEALAAATAEGTTYIKVTGNTTETAAGIVLANDVVIYSDATGDARPVITLAADANTGAASGYYFWIKVNGAALTFDGVQINTSPFITAKDTSKNTGSLILDNGAKVSLIDSTADHGGSKTKNGGFVYLGEATHSGDFLMDNSTVTSGNRGIYIEKSTGSSSITLLNNSKLASTITHGIQCSATTPAALAVTVVDSEISANGVGMYNRAVKAEVTLVNATITSTSQVVDARNEAATLDLVVVGGTFKGVDLVKFKSPTAVINIIGANVDNVTTVINNELSKEDITVTTYGVTGKNANVPAEKITTLREAAAKELVATLFADDAALKDAALAAVPHIHVFENEVATEAYFAAAATCASASKYYVSCACGEPGTDTFVVGEALPHTPGEGYQNDGENHYATCTECEAKLYSDHVFDQEIAGEEYLITPAGCTSNGEYYKSCVCGAAGEETFTVDALGHLWGEWTTVVEPTVDAEGLAEKVCDTCGESETKAIEKLPAPEVEAPTEAPSVLDQIKGKVIGVKNMVAGKLGCGGSIGGASIIIMIAAAGAVVLRKKED